MRFLILLTVLMFSVSAFSGASYAQEEEENKGTLASMFQSWNQKQREKLKSAAGVIDVEKQEEQAPPPEKIKPVYKAEKAKGARSRIFDPVTSYIEQRRAYQQKNLANIEKMDAQRSQHLEDALDIDGKLSNERDLHLKASLEIDAKYQDERNQHLQESLDTDGAWAVDRRNYLEKYMANHRKYLELDVEN